MEVLRIVWWLLTGAWLAAFAVLAPRSALPPTGTAMPAATPLWLALGGAAIVAVWPPLFENAAGAVAIVMVAWSLMLHRVGYASGIVPAFVLGVMVGALFTGSLLSPFALLVGLTSLAMFALIAAAWSNANRALPIAAAAYAVLFAGCGFWLVELDGARLTGIADPNAPSNPLLKTVAIVPGAWLANANAHPALYLLPVIAIFAAWRTAADRARPGRALLWSTLVPPFTIASAGSALFPFLTPSLTIWDASSSRLVLAIALGATVVILPAVIVLTRKKG
ncbi:MAG: cytochrome d ubiquinol oxidase subunit II [Alphaproteobacteria bacterium]|nr:cytochrome d ubiquinol oxidase subunit II [Alphaproteobacteria bacterium]